MTDIFGATNSSIGITGISSVGGIGLWLFLMIITIIMVVGIIALIFSSFQRYKKLMGLFGFLAKTAGYFGKGLIALSIFGVAYVGILALGTGVSEGVIQPFVLLFWGGVIIGGFFGIAGLGYLFDRFVFKRASRFHKKYKKEAKP